jgi:hypothetical protein
MWFFNRQKSAIAVHFFTHLLQKKVFYERKWMKKPMHPINGRQKMFVSNSLVKYLFFTRRICVLASLGRQIFLLVKKSITLLTCCITKYFLWSSRLIILTIIISIICISANASDQNVKNPGSALSTSSRHSRGFRPSQKGDLTSGVWFRGHR